MLAVAGAALAAVGAALTWWSADYLDPLTGPLVVTLSGADSVPELIPLALVGLAGLGAALATHGIPRRLVGVVLLVCGGVITVRSVLSVGSPPAALAGSLSRPADPVGAAQVHPVGPALAVLGGLLLASAGVLVVLGRGARARMGGRYDAPTRAATAAVAADPTGDPENWWKVLDAGADPTADPTARSAVDPTAGSAVEAPAGSAVDPTAGSAVEAPDDPPTGTAADPPADPADSATP